jgi:hypothetical protein
MLTAKLFAGTASLLVVAVILARLSPSPRPPIPMYLQLIGALFCVIFALTFVVAELWLRRPLNQTIGLVQFGFVGIFVCTFVFEFELYPLLSNKPDILGAYLIPASAFSFLIACALFIANAAWAVVRFVRHPANTLPD